MAASINGHTRVLQWSDFPTKRLDPPGEGDEADAASTTTRFSFTQQPQIRPVPRTSPEKYHILDNFVLHVALVTTGDDASWKASWVASQAAAERERLLTHERGHYGLVALLARDCFRDLQALLTNKYDSVSDAQDAIDAVFAPYNTQVQPIQDAYDSDSQTRHGFNTPAQIIWNGFISQARVNGTPILTLLSNAGISV